MYVCWVCILSVNKQKKQRFGLCEAHWWHSYTFSEKRLCSYSILIYKLTRVSIIFCWDSVTRNSCVKLNKYKPIMDIIKLINFVKQIKHNLTQNTPLSLMIWLFPQNSVSQPFFSRNWSESLKTTRIASRGRQEGASAPYWKFCPPLEKSLRTPINTLTRTLGWESLSWRI